MPKRTSTHSHHTHVKPTSQINIYNPSSSGNLIVCYHTNWAQYRQGDAKFFPENIDPLLCDMIIYSFAKLEGDRLEPFEWNDLSTPWSRGMYERTMDLKKQNRALKILIAVGGWNAGSGITKNFKNKIKHSYKFISN